MTNLALGTCDFGDASEGDDDPRAGRLAAAMSRLVGRFGSFKTVGDVYVTIADEVAGLLTYERLAISRFHPEAEASEIVFERCLVPGPSRVGVLIPMVGGLVSRLLAERRPLLYTIGEDDRDAGDPLRRARGIQQLALSPIIIDEQYYGAISINSVDVERYRPGDLWLLESMAGLLGMLVSGVRLRHDAQRNAADAEHLVETARVLATTRDLERTGAMAVARVGEALGGACALLVRTGDGAVEVAAVFAPEPADVPRIRHIADGHAASGAPAVPANGSAVEDVDTAATRARLADQGVEDLILCPLHVDDEALGTLMVLRLAGSDGAEVVPPRFSAAERDRSRRLGRQIAPAVLNARLHVSMTRALHESEALRRIGQELARDHDTGRLLNLIARSTYSLFGADYVGVMRPAAVETVRWDVVVGNQTDVHIRAGAHLHRSHTVRHLRAGEHLVVQDFPVDPPLDAEEYIILREEGIRAALALPIMAAGRVLGGLFIGFRKRRLIPPADVRFAQALALSVATALQAAGELGEPTRTP
ncbi:MAG: GAF domain-containing protein [Chloroflexia bacterium]|nr:GAF domain-containing protein [Chloroflexia bacterium]